MLLETIAHTKMSGIYTISTSPHTPSTQPARTRMTCSLAEANEFAAAWIEAWNSHDLDRILALFSEDAIYSSPLVRRIGGGPSDSIRGRFALHSYFSSVLREFPSLHVHLRAVYAGSESLILLCDAANGLVECNKIKLNHRSQISRVWVYYGKLKQTNPEHQAITPNP